MILARRFPRALAALVLLPALAAAAAETQTWNRLATEFSAAATADLARADAVIKLPGVTIHGGDKKSVDLSGTVSLTEGILEFVAVEPNTREYESLFAVTAKPSALQFALLLIGCEPGPPVYKAKAGEKTGDRLRVIVEWQQGGQTRQAPPERFLMDRRTGKPAGELAWVLTGSMFVKDFSGREIFLADAEQAFISLWWSSAMPINLGGDYGNPYQGDNQGFEINRETIPPKGTPVRLIISRYQK